MELALEVATVANEALGAALIVAILALGVGLLLVKDWHPYRAHIRRSQRLALEGKVTPPTRSRFWEVTLPLCGFWIWLSFIWIVVKPRDGFALVSGLFSVLVFLGLAISDHVYQKWREQSGKARAGSWGDVTIKALWKSRIQDVLTLQRIVEDPAQYENKKDLVTVKGMVNGKPVIEITMAVEVFQTGGLDPEFGITVPNRGPIMIWKSRSLSAHQARQLLQGMQALAVDDKSSVALDLEHAWAAGLALGDMYLGMGEAIFLRMGYDHDPENPTPRAIRELVQRHAAAGRLVYKASTWIIFIPDLYRGLEKIDAVSTPRPSHMVDILYDQQAYIEYLEERNIGRGKSRQKMNTSEGAVRDRREEVTTEESW